jgi:acetyl esterase/lipase
MTVKISNVLDELRGPLRKLPRIPIGSVWGRALTRTILRLLPSAKVVGVRIEKRQDLNPALRIYHPIKRKSKGALYWIHGGGYVIGRASLDDRLCAATASELGIVVVSVEYRLAPEHPFPAPLDDCHAGWRWLQQSAAALGVDPRSIAIGGQSAGGGLAACLIQRVHDSEEIKAAAQWLFCPMLDDRTAAKPELNEVENFVWSNRDNAAGWRAYLAQEPGAATLPHYAAAARRENISGLPPAWIGVGTIDLFFHEDREYAERLCASGIDTVFMTVAGAPHGFEAWAFDSRAAQAFIGDAQHWLGRIIPPLSVPAHWATEDSDPGWR